MINKANLRPRTQERYFGVLNYLVGQCSTSHRHRHSFKEQTIGSGTRFRALESCLQEIAELHGSETAHQARTVVEKYILDQMIRDELIPASPIAGKRLDLDGGVKRAPRETVALSRTEWKAVLDHLLAMDPAEGVTAPKSGMYTLKDRIARRANVIDLTLLQATTGLRIGEASNIRWGHEAHLTAHDEMTITVTADLAKNHKARTITVADVRVVERMTRRRESAEEGHPVIGPPAMPWKPWSKRQRDEAIRELYKELAEALGIKVLETRRTHVWRATLNTMLVELPAKLRAEYLGHTVEVNYSNFTDVSDSTPMTAAIRDKLQ